MLCPGHGEPIWDVRGKLDEYSEHRLDRERRLLAALERGLRSEDELLDAAWDDAPAELRPFAAMSLRAHLEKLRSERRVRALANVNCGWVGELGCSRCSLTGSFVQLNDRVHRGLHVLCY